MIAAGFVSLANDGHSVCSVNDARASVNGWGLCNGIVQYVVVHVVSLRSEFTSHRDT